MLVVMLLYNAVVPFANKEGALFSPCSIIIGKHKIKITIIPLADAFNEVIARWLEKVFNTFNFKGLCKKCNELNWRITVFLFTEYNRLSHIVFARH